MTASETTTMAATDSTGLAIRTARKEKGCFWRVFWLMTPWISAVDSVMIALLRIESSSCGAGLTTP